MYGVWINIRVLLISVLRALIKVLKIEWKVKFWIKKNIFYFQKVECTISNFQDNISFYNSLTNVQDALVNIFLNIKVSIREESRIWTSTSTYFHNWVGSRGEFTLLDNSFLYEYFVT